MAVWRAKLLKLFPEDKQTIEKESLYSIFHLMLNRVHEAHIDRNPAMLSKIYGFAMWCAEQESKLLWNPAGVSFYEHLFDCDQQYWNDVIAWLHPSIIRNHQSLWEFMLPKDRYQELCKLLSVHLKKGKVKPNRHSEKLI
ncbi:MAG: hypothetical protein KDK50_02095 [Chlamydiia bacterium]|nr:hypothetical protein [Chlamydiia bacterium]